MDLFDLDFNRFFGGKLTSYSNVMRYCGDIENFLEKLLSILKKKFENFTFYLHKIP